MGSWGYVLTVMSFVLLLGCQAHGDRPVRPLHDGRRYEGGVPDPGIAEDRLAERFARYEIEESEDTVGLTVLRRGRGALR
ncbi:hypothetical protein GCM10009628_01780 [Paeniglutamicibacter kerguelensis]|uniref:Membrane protein n=1 Tax=Paeniglutamicibacter kerguelensis TaxID=254788 RepID=A0ABS4XHY0_9MICC|nr:putative membrane protein [Paeniglutamicibacter kerguelensis]